MPIRPQHSAWNIEGGQMHTGEKGAPEETAERCWRKTHGMQTKAS